MDATARGANGPSDNALAMVVCLREIERDMAVLLGAAPPREAHVFECPICDFGMVVKAETPLPSIPEMECRLRRLGCPQCGMQTNRIFNAAFGYAPFPV